MSDLLNGRTIVVTGGARGIGQAYCLGLARQGANVVTADILDSGETVDLLNDIKPGSGLGLKVDISDAASSAAMAKQAVDKFGQIDGLINNAAMFGKSSANKGAVMNSFSDISEEDWDRMMNINVKGTWNGVKAVYPYMKKKGYGKIINISSNTIQLGNPNLLHYVTSKGAVATMTRCLARELGPDGIRVNAITPGFTMSQASKDILKDSNAPELTEVMRSMSCLGQIQEPETLVGTAIYLMAELSDFVTGQVLNVDGGACFTGL